MATARSIRSNAAPASNRPHTKHQSSSRPELRVVSNPRGNEQGNVVGRVIEWTRTRSAPLVHVAIAVIFLVGTLFGALMLRTQMVQNSFEAAQIAFKLIGIALIYDGISDIWIVSRAVKAAKQMEQDLNAIDTEGKEL